MKTRSYSWWLFSYLSAMIAFLCFVVLTQRSNDVWTLDGIVVPTIIFVFISFAAEVLVKDNKKVLLLSMFFLATINLVSGLKYQFFYGTYDTPAHYRFADQIAFQGHVPQGEFYSGTYGSNPGMHVLLASLSLISGISVNDIFRLIFPPLCGLLIPLMVYFIGNRILDNTTMKYTIIASSFPILSAYSIYGTILAFPLYFMLIAVFIRLAFSKKANKAFLLIFVVFGSALIISHAVTSLFVSLLLPIALLILFLLQMKRRKPLDSLPVMVLIIPSSLFVVLLWTWWTNTAVVNLNYFVDVAKSLLSPPIPAVPTRFYEIPLLSRLQILVVSNLASALVGVLSLSGLYVFLRQVKRNELSRRAESFYFYVLAVLGVVVAFLCIQFLSNFGVLNYDRLLTYGIVLCAFFVGITLTRLDRKFKSSLPKTKNLLLLSLVFAVALCSLIQFFPYQPLVPRANVLSNSLPENAYIVDLVQVNTIYQKEMISFAENHSTRGVVISDIVTRLQEYGFSSPAFFSRNPYYSPLLPNPDQTIEWDLLLLHTIRAGPFLEKIEYRTEDIIDDFRLNAGNLIYDNGESFVVSHSVVHTR